MKTGPATEERNCWLCKFLDRKRPMRLRLDGTVRWWCKRRCECVNDPATEMVCNRFDKEGGQP